jgi:hypothetical protein
MQSQGAMQELEPVSSIGPTYLPRRQHVGCRTNGPTRDPGGCEGHLLRRVVRDAGVVALLHP